MQLRMSPGGSTPCERRSRPELPPSSLMVTTAVMSTPGSPSLGSALRASPFSTLGSPVPPPIAPMRVGMGLSRDQEIDYAQERGIEIPITKASPYSIDVNLWGRSCETGVLEDPWVTPPPDAYEWTVAAGDAPAPGIAARRAGVGGVPRGASPPARASCVRPARP